MRGSGFQGLPYLLPIAIGLSGAVLSWLASDACPLLIAVAGASSFGGGRPSLLLMAGAALALGVFLVVVTWGGQEADFRLAVILATAFGISGVVHLHHVTDSPERDGDQARMIVESMPGHGWAADPAGKFIYVSPSILKYLGQPRNELDRIEGTDEFGWRQVVHPDDYDRIVGQWLRCLETGEPYENEHRIRRFDGTYRWFRNSGMPSRDAGGRITGWYGTTIDIHEQKTAEVALRENERRLQQLIDAVPALIWSTTAEGTPTYLNKRYTDVTGAVLADLTAPDGTPAPLSVVHPDDLETSARIRARAFAAGTPYFVRYRQIRRNGTYHWTETRAEALRDDSGAILQWYGVSVDIHDLVMAQEALRDRERELSKLVDLVPSHVWRLRPDGEPTFFNKRMADFLGLDVTDTNRPGMSALEALIETVHPGDTALFDETLRRCLATGESFEMRYRLRRADGAYRWMASRAEPLRDEDGCIVQWYGLCHDIDDQMQIEEALRSSKQQLEQMLDALPVNILSFSPSGKMTYASKRYLEKVGSPQPNIQHFDALARDVAHPDDFPAMFRNASDGFAAGRAFVNRFRRREKDGVYRWIEARAQPLRDASGAILQWYIASIDIEDEMRAQEALRDRERALRQLVETLPAMLDCAAPDGEPIYRSQQLREFLGYALEDLDGAGKSRLDGTLDASVHPDDVAGVRDGYAHSLATGDPYARRHRLRRFDGEYRWVETRAAPMRDAEGVIAQWNVICLDVDGEVRAQGELRLTREKMARASQAASLAELSASIAHEVNQPLAAIVATSHACRRWLSATPPNLERAGITLERIIRDANSASEVVSRIRALFSQMDRTRSPADLAEVIAEVRRLMADELAVKNIRLETDFDAGLPAALIDRVQIQQVLVNLIRNAADALNTASADARLIKLRTIPDQGDAIRVEVKDFGAGIADPERVFEPFFTTKENGMGMGLAICRSIIESHDGRLWAANNTPKGTTFAFTLPIEAGETR